MTESVAIYILGAIALVLSLALLWYFIKTVAVIWRYNSLMALAAVVFSPIIQIIFFFIPKDDEFDKHESGLFKKYFLSIGLIALLGIVAAVVIPATKSPKGMDVYGLNNVDINELKFLSNQSDAKAQFSLAREYKLGKVIPQDYSKALHWAKKSAEQGNAGGQVILGMMYYQGEGVEQNYTEAFKWYEKAAEQGDDFAQILVSEMYYDGEGVEQNYTEAFKWYEKLANKDSSRAQFSLGNMYYKGEGVEQNYTEALRWYKKAAEQGNDNAQAVLGLMYQDGVGVRQNNTEAKEWFGKACDNGNQIGCDLYQVHN
jgi:TPR repeat protein